MSKKLVSLFLVGATLAYAGILSLGDSLYVGLGMALFGGLLGALPTWKAVRHFWNSAGGVGGFSPRAGTGKRRKSIHLRVVHGNRKDPPTYH